MKLVNARRARAVAAGVDMAAAEAVEVEDTAVAAVATAAVVVAEDMAVAAAVVTAAEVAKAVSAATDSPFSTSRVGALSEFALSISNRKIH